MTDWNKQPRGALVAAKLLELVATVRRIEMLAKLARAKAIAEMQAKVALSRRPSP